MTLEGTEKPKNDPESLQAAAAMARATGVKPLPGYSMPAGQAEELAFVAHAYRHDAPLVNNSDDKTLHRFSDALKKIEKNESHASLKALKEAAIAVLEQAINATTDDALKARLGKMIEAISKASGDTINAILGAAISAVASAENGLQFESLSAHKARLWQEARQAEHKAETQSHELDKHKTKPELDKEKEDEDKLRRLEEEYDKRKAASASKEELEALEKQISDARGKLYLDRKESLTRIANDSKIPSEDREKARSAGQTNEDGHAAQEKLERAIADEYTEHKNLIPKEEYAAKVLAQRASLSPTNATPTTTTQSLNNIERLVAASIDPNAKEITAVEPAPKAASGNSLGGAAGMEALAAMLGKDAANMPQTGAAEVSVADATTATPLATGSKSISSATVKLG